MKILFIHEFGPSPEESMMQDLIVALSRRLPELQSQYFTGFLRRYAGGGTSPWRLLNLVYMFLFLPFVLLTFRPDHILTRTAPPGIQIWTVLLGAILRIPVSCWLMDYHPEVEVRLLRKWKLQSLARPLEAVDRFCLLRFKMIIVLDEAMRTLIAARSPRVPILVHPTWNKGFKFHGRPEKSYPLEKWDCLKLVYAGNLGTSHPLQTLAVLLKKMRSVCPVSLLAVGASASGEERLQAMANDVGIPLAILPRTAFAGMGDVFQKHDVDLGLVLLDDELAGCLSPSKFSAYIAFGVPLLYIGPEGTNTDLICSKFDAGFSFPNNPSDKTLTAVIGQISQPGRVRAVAGNVEAAVDYFAGKDENSLADAILPYLTVNSSESSACGSAKATVSA